ncbi:tigger transposable element-derived protein 1 isoform X1 [Centruroides vittatus]|uniref:tigger transposable element-derived protein 1 isoform X1 n=1 Tax=Centruroides vittatus TaxID=120091 RepID=UPI003510B630
MSGKRKVKLENKKSLKKRKAITLEEKLEILSLHEAGTKVMDLAYKFRLSHSTISTILKNRRKVLDEVKSASPMQATTIRKREGLIPEVEKVLIAWINRRTRTVRTPLSQAAISAKALSIFDTLKSRRGETSEGETFSASKGWFDRFRKRAGWHKTKARGKAAGADDEAVKDFPEKLAKVIVEEGYCLRQVFNVDETGLFWKRMPLQTSVAKEEKSMPGFKAAKDWVTLLLGANAAGDCKLKPLLIYRAETPRALKGVYKRTLPVIWKWNARAWMTGSIFKEWFYRHFVPEVKEYCTNNDLPFKILLLLDNAPCHPLILQHAHPNIKIMFFPLNTTSVLQPMYQGVVTAFKAYYLRRTFEEILKAVDTEENLTVREFWRKFNILDAIKIIVDAWNEITELNLKGVWKKLCPHFVEDFEDFELLLEKETTTVVEIANRLNLEVSAKDVNELLNSHEKEPTVEELIEIAEQGTVETDEDNNDGEEEEEEVLEEPNSAPTFTLQRLAEAFEKIDSGLKILQTDDPNFERSSLVLDMIRDSLSCYMEIYREKKKNSLLLNKH